MSLFEKQYPGNVLNDGSTKEMELTRDAHTNPRRDGWVFASRCNRARLMPAMASPTTLQAWSFRCERPARATKTGL